MRRFSGRQRNHAFHIMRFANHLYPTLKFQRFPRMLPGAAIFVGNENPHARR
jgi:hypothetical protein